MSIIADSNSARANLPRLLWQNDRKSEDTNMGKFRDYVTTKRGLKFSNYKEFHKWSIDRIDQFWDDVWDYEKPIYDGNKTISVDTNARIDQIPKFFEGTCVNWAENMLYFKGKGDERYSTNGKEDHKIAIWEASEGGTYLRSYTWGQFRHDTARMAAALRFRGLTHGDRVGIVASNSYETLVIHLAVAAVGAIFSGCGTDMGVRGIVDRFSQIEPCFIFFDDQTIYNGKKIDLWPKIKAVIEKLAKPTKVQNIVIIPRILEGVEADLEYSMIPNCETISMLLDVNTTFEPLAFAATRFEDPLFIAYSSGTTGVPKCIVHGNGNVVMNNYVDAHITSGMDINETRLQITTIGWIMYMISLGGLQCGGTCILYDGSPLSPDPLAIIKLVEKLKVTNLGVSPGYLLALKSHCPNLRENFNLTTLKVVYTAGMVCPPLVDEWFYDKGFERHTHFSNTVGTTDMAGGFAGPNPLEPVYAGQVQCAKLGFALEVVDPASDRMHAQVLTNGESGEITVTKPFVSQPVCFWGADGPQKYHEAYFARFENRWTQGDFMSIDPITGGLVCHGRSDGTLNPSGIRFGSSDIYNLLTHEFADEIADSLCIAQHRATDHNESVFLFVKMVSGKTLTAELVQRIKTSILHDFSKHHVPKYVFEIPGEIPVTTNGKKVETAVRQVVSGEKVHCSGALKNPESLKWFEQFVKVEELVPQVAKL